jgi:hypothetical protein
LECGDFPPLWFFFPFLPLLESLGRQREKQKRRESAALQGSIGYV